MISKMIAIAVLLRESSRKRFSLVNIVADQKVKRNFQKSGKICRVITAKVCKDSRRKSLQTLAVITPEFRAKVRI